ncbi:hypothetical protein QVD17_17520 [Tagetes erecta]|uniref:ELM2 domain-containing protein n=1 Tax=Tagetes erecta TaxID=13708 RepID=A0AAD8KWV5_TARER|nr:hypothetical protein QVD17_17520 [Tagetes erecta]
MSTHRYPHPILIYLYIPSAKHICNTNISYKYSNTLTMKSTPKRLKSTRMDRFSYINDDNLRLAIPIGPRFQADVPEWTGPPRKNNGLLNESDRSKCLGVVVWSMSDTNPEVNGCIIGKGRPESCDCTHPGSIPCVQRHISKKTAHLQIVLGSAFWTWKFDQMGEAVAKLWQQADQQRLIHIMNNNPFSQGRDFIKVALEYFPMKLKKDIVDFYFNVYLPRRMSIQTRSGCMVVNTDDEEEKSKTRFKGSRKKARVDSVTSYSPKLVKARYLTGRR